MNIFLLSPVPQFPPYLAYLQLEVRSENLRATLKINFQCTLKRGFQLRLHQWFIFLTEHASPRSAIKEGHVLDEADHV